MELKILINALLIIIIIYLLLDSVSVKYTFGMDKDIINKKQEDFNNSLKIESSNQSETPSSSNIDELYAYMDNKYDPLSTDAITYNDEVKPDNYYLSDNNTSNFNSNVTNTSTFYNMNLDGLTSDKLQQTNYKLIDNTKESENRLVDKQSQYSSYLDNNINNEQTVYKPDVWKYKNELPMNGGSFNGLSGFDSLGGGYAIYNKNDLSIEKCNSEVECKKVDDLRNGMMERNQ